MKSWESHDMFVIRLEGLRFFSHIGVFEQERRVGNEFHVDLRLETDASSFREECLETTISYADVYEIVSAEMSRESLLLESVAKKIADAVIKRWCQVGRVEVKITKLAPPIAGIQGSCSVEYITSQKEPQK